MQCNPLRQGNDVVAKLLRCSPTHRHPLQLLSVQHYPFVVKVRFCSSTRSLCTQRYSLWFLLQWQ